MDKINIGQIAASIAIITAFWVFVEKVIKSIDTMFDKKLNPIKEELVMQSDVVYQILDHLATNNNTGGMKKALEDYNKYQRHNNEKK